MALVTPSSVARDRYHAGFASSIFDLPEGPRPQTCPAGKRRDQTVSELFGHGSPTQRRALRLQEGTFEPRVDSRTAAQRKQDFLSSQADWAPTSAEPLSSPAAPEEPKWSTDPITRRVQENSANIFGAAPTAQETAVHARWAQNRLQPTSFRWYERNPVNDKDDAHSAPMRAVHQQRSTVFKGPGREAEDQQVVDARAETQREAREERDESDDRRRNNVYYSDLFGRSTPQPDRRPDHHRHHVDEECIPIQADWTDRQWDAAKAPHEESVSERRFREYTQPHVFELPHNADAHPKLPHVYDDLENNSSKIRRESHDQSVIHQRHMESSALGSDFYVTAAKRTAWEVAEVRIRGLAATDSPESVTKMVQTAGYHVVRCDANMDPVNNSCKGDCTVRIRYNPSSAASPMNVLLEHLERKGLRVSV